MMMHQKGQTHADAASELAEKISEMGKWLYISYTIPLNGFTNFYIVTVLQVIKVVPLLHISVLCDAYKWFPRQ